MFDVELENLKRLFAEQSARARTMVETAVKALVDRDRGLIDKVLHEYEPQCNEAEKEIESKAVSIIALYSPRATYIREIVAVIKANKDLERIGDQAVNIAGNASYLISKPPLKPLIDIPRMSQTAIDMLERALEGFLQSNLEKAKSVFELDNVVDALNEQVIRELITYMMNDPTTIERAIRLMFISKNLERIGDLSMNIAEDVVYYITGDDVRHPSLDGDDA